MQTIIGILVMLALAALFGARPGGARPGGTRPGGTRPERQASYPSSWPKPAQMGYPPEMEEGWDALTGPTESSEGVRLAGNAVPTPGSAVTGVVRETGPVATDLRRDSAVPPPSEPDGTSAFPESPQEFLKGIVLAEILKPPRALAGRRR